MTNKINSKVKFTEADVKCINKISDVCIEFELSSDEMVDDIVEGYVLDEVSFTKKEKETIKKLDDIRETTGFCVDDIIRAVMFGAGKFRFEYEKNE